MISAFEQILEEFLFNYWRLTLATFVAACFGLWVPSLNFRETRDYWVRCLGLFVFPLMFVVVWVVFLQELGPANVSVVGLTLLICLVLFGFGYLALFLYRTRHHLVRSLAVASFALWVSLSTLVLALLAVIGDTV